MHNYKDSHEYGQRRTKVKEEKEEMLNANTYDYRTQQNIRDSGKLSTTGLRHVIASKCYRLFKALYKTDTVHGNFIFSSENPGSCLTNT